MNIVLECGCELEHSGHSHNAIVRTVKKCIGDSALSCVNPSRKYEEEQKEIDEIKKILIHAFRKLERLKK